MSGARAAQRPASVHAAAHAAPPPASSRCVGLAHRHPHAPCCWCCHPSLMQERQLDFVGSTSSAEYSSVLPCRCAHICRCCYRPPTLPASSTQHSHCTQQTKSDGDQSPH